MERQVPDNIRFLWAEFCSARESYLEIRRLIDWTSTEQRKSQKRIELLRQLLAIDGRETVSSES
jgi:hypothetical protein